MLTYNMKKLLFITFILTVFSSIGQTTKHLVAKGETLYSISKKYKISVEELKKNNQLTSNELSLGQELIIKSTPSHKSESKHTVQKGETLYSISKKYNVSVSKIKEWNDLESESLKLGQTLILFPTPNTIIKKEDLKRITHSVIPGETLYSISKDYNMTVEEVIQLNKLKSNALNVGQQLIVTQNDVSNEEKQKVEKINNEIELQQKRDIVHTVKPKETLFSISRIYSVPVAEIKQLNKLTTYEISVGQKLIIQDKKAGNELSYKNAEPSFLTKETGNASLNFNSKIAHDKFSYCLHKTLKVGTIIKITNVDSNTFIYARVMGNLAKQDPALVGINQVIANKISNGLTTFPVSIEYAR